MGPSFAAATNYNNTLIDRRKLAFWIPGDLEENWYCDQDSAKVYTETRKFQKKPKMRDVLVRGIRKFGRAAWKKSRVSPKKYCRDCYVSVQDNLWEIVFAQENLKINGLK